MQWNTFQPALPVFAWLCSQIQARTATKLPCAWIEPVTIASHCKPALVHTRTVTPNGTLICVRRKFIFISARMPDINFLWQCDVVGVKRQRVSDMPQQYAHSQTLLTWKCLFCQEVPAMPPLPTLFHSSLWAPAEKGYVCVLLRFARTNDTGHS